MIRHTHVVGARTRDRAAVLDRASGARIAVRCHRGLRGPYTGVDTLLARVVPDAQRRWPDLVAHHRLELLDCAPELSAVIGPPPATLASESVFEERTRWYNQVMVRCMSHSVVTFLRAYARLVAAAGESVPTIVFDEMHDADVTTQEFVALLLRRVDAETWPVVLGSTGNLGPILADAVSAYADEVTASAVPGTDSGTAADYVDSDGTIDDPVALAAYQALDPDGRATLHDRRADELADHPTRGVQIAALPFHRERGSDPTHASAAAVMTAIQLCTTVGFSEMVIELGERGRALIDPVEDPESYRKITNMLITEVLSFKRFEYAMELCSDLRRRYALPLVHMTTSYFMAMMYTRFTEPRDHEKAMEWQNNASVIAAGLPDRRQRLILEGFQENAMALVEMHRGNLATALELVHSAMTRLDDELGPQEWALHRSQLLYNRARLLSALGRKDEAYEDFSVLIELDPYYTDYLCERAKIHRRRGEFDEALADYDRAVELGPPFPELFHNRGALLAELDDVDAALADFDLVLDMEPDDVETRLSRAELRLACGDRDDARADAEMALALRPDEPRLLCVLGMIELEEENWTAALARLDAAVALDPRYPAALINRAVASYQLDEPAAAVDDLTAALALVGQDPDVLLNRGMAWAAAGDVESALSDFDAALAMPDADEGELRYQRARCQLLAGSDDAAQDLRECLRLGVHTDEIERLLAGVA